MQMTHMPPFVALVEWVNFVYCANSFRTDEHILGNQRVVHLIQCLGCVGCQITIVLELMVD